MNTEAKDLYGKKLPTGYEIVDAIKKEYEGKEREFMYPYITGALIANYNNLLLQIEIMQTSKKIKTNL